MVYFPREIEISGTSRAEMRPPHRGRRRVLELLEDEAVRQAASAIQMMRVYRWLRLVGDRQGI